jgi:hypothetical protein
MKLNEVVDRKVKIESVLRKYKIENYTINDDLTVDVNGKVEFSGNTFATLPIKFNVVNGDFKLTDCKKLTSLKGCPHHVGGTFWFKNNRIIRTLEDGPTTVDGNYVVGNSLIKDLRGSPKHIQQNYGITECLFLKSLNGCPETVGGVFSIYRAYGLPSIDYLPKSANEINLNACDKIRNILKIFQVRGIKIFSFYHNQPSMVNIINKYLPTRDVIGCQDELIEAGFEEYARTK